MHEQEAISRAETWYFQQYHTRAHGHLSLPDDRHALHEDPFLCIDLVPEQGTEVVRVLLELAGEEVVLLEGCRPCARCPGRQEGAYSRLPQRWIRRAMRWWGP